jgi:hypothetical protein
MSKTSEEILKSPEWKGCCRFEDLKFRDYCRIRDAQMILKDYGLEDKDLLKQVMLSLAQ